MEHKRNPWSSSAWPPGEAMKNNARACDFRARDASDRRADYRAEIVRQLAVELEAEGDPSTTSGRTEQSA